MKKALALVAACAAAVPALQAQKVSSIVTNALTEPYGVAVDHQNRDLYVSDSVNDRVIRFSGADGQVETFNGDFFNPQGIVAARQGVVIADSGNHQIKWIGRDGSRRTLAGSELGNRNGAGETALFNSPTGLAADSAGNIYIADLKNSAIRRLGTNNVVSTVAEGFYEPAAVAVDSEGRLFVADTRNHQIKIVEANGTVRSIGGTRGLSGHQDGASSTFNFPRGLVWIGGETGLLVSDTGNSLIRKVYFNKARQAWVTETVVGGTEPLTGKPIAGKADGDPLKEARLKSPVSLAVDELGLIIFADLGNDAVRSWARPTLPKPVITPETGVYINTVAVGVSNAVAGATYRFTTTNQEPTAVSPLFNSGTVLNESKLLNIRGFSPDFMASDTTTMAYLLAVDDITPSVAGGTFSNAFPLALRTLTTNAIIRYTSDGTNPTASSPVWTNGFFVGTLKAQAFRDGFTESEVFSATYNFVVAAPTIQPGSASSKDSVEIRLATPTDGADLYWTIDGTEPTPNNGFRYTGPFHLGTNGTLKVAGFKNGFASSSVSSGTFELTADAPVILANGPSTSINSLGIVLTNGTPGSRIYYTLNGSKPNATSFVYNGPITLTENARLTAVAVRDGFRPSAEVTADFQIQVDKPSMFPPGGFFPNGTTVRLEVQRSNAVIYYTLDGRTPTTNDLVYSGPFQVNQVNQPGADLRVVTARAFAPNTLPSEVTSGQPLGANAIGIPTDFNAGIGSTIVVPVVLNLKSNDVLRSLQFRVEVAPVKATSPALSTELRPLTFTTNDYVRSVGSTRDGKPMAISYSTYSHGNTNGLIITAIGDNSNFEMKDFGTVALIAVNLPAGASEGENYQVTLLEPSGTSDGVQKVVPLTPLSPKTIKIKNVTYLVGDSAPGGWYNAGEFGNGTLDNGDVNNAFFASLGVRQPYPFSDAFDAMDAFPVDGAGSVGGDGEIRYLDWQVILMRSLRLQTSNWQRAWAPNGAKVNQRVGSLSSANAAASVKHSTAGILSNTLAQASQLWNREGQIRAGSLTNVVPGNTVLVPVTLKMFEGYQVAGLAFRATVEAENGAPAVTEPVRFVAHEIPAPSVQNQGFGPNDLLCAWNLVPSPAFNPQLQGSTLLGYLRITVPHAANKGQFYRVRFSAVDGATDISTRYDFESLPGFVWVLGSPTIRNDAISEEWKRHFFSNVTNILNLADLDSDNDGVSNWLEYLTGTNPTNAQSFFQLRTSLQGTNRLSNVLRLNWPTTSGKKYVLEVSSGVNSGWQPVMTNVIGDGTLKEFVETNLNNGQRFYRIRLQD